MTEQLESAIKKLIDKSTEAKSGVDAMQFSQAALNLANALIGVRLLPKKP